MEKPIFSSYFKNVSSQQYITILGINDEQFDKFPALLWIHHSVSWSKVRLGEALGCESICTLGVSCRMQRYRTPCGSVNPPMLGRGKTRNDQSRLTHLLQSVIMISGQNRMNGYSLWTLEEQLFSALKNKVAFKQPVLNCRINKNYFLFFFFNFFLKSARFPHSLTLMILVAVGNHMQPAVKPVAPQTSLLLTIKPPPHTPVVCRWTTSIQTFVSVCRMGLGHLRCVCVCGNSGVNTFAYQCSWQRSSCRYLCLVFAVVFWLIPRL